MRLILTGVTAFSLLAFSIFSAYFPWLSIFQVEVDCLTLDLQAVRLKSAGIHKVDPDAHAMELYLFGSSGIFSSPRLAKRYDERAI